MINFGPYGPRVSNIVKCDLGGAGTEMRFGPNDRLPSPIISPVQ